MIDECDDLQLQEVVTVKQPDESSFHVCIVKPYAPPPPLGRPRLRGKRKKKLLNEQPHSSDSNDLVIQNHHRRELRVDKDPEKRFDVCREEVYNDLASHHRIRIPEVQFAPRTLRQSVLFEEFSIDSIGPLLMDQLCFRVHPIDVGHHRLEETVT